VIVDEYQYLQACVDSRYWIARAKLNEYYAAKIKRACEQGDLALECQLEQEESVAVRELVAQRWRGIDIIAWLTLDTALRQEGKTYPDVYEKQPVKAHSSPPSESPLESH
jgi:hypothetical protein